jgi:hypothetical protein
MEVFHHILIYLILFTALTLYLVLNMKSVKSVNNKNLKCGLICQNIDNVSDPKYNMQQIVKQSILLEEHLANKNKRCRDCITKHFLHIIGLAEEAQMLATDKIHKYPLINECVDLYNRLFNKWLKNYEIDHSNNDNFCKCGDELRNMRKKLIAVYFFDDQSFLQ